MAPPASAAPTPFDTLCLEALKALGKTLSQMNLYKVGHPAVRATIDQSHGLLTQVLGQVGGELVYSLDNDKLIANGRVVATTGQVPNALLLLFSRYKLASLTFKPGLPAEELTALCEMAALRADQAKDLNAGAFLEQRAVAHIALNEAIYTKAGQEPPPPPPQQAEPDPAAPKMALAQKLESASVEESITELVRAAAPDPREQLQIIETVMRRVREELERKVQEATVALRKEKTVLQNEQVRTQAVLTNMAEGVVVVDDAGKILMMNPAAEEIYGKTLGEAAGKPLIDSVKEEHLLTMSSELATPNDREVNKDVDVMSTDDTRRTLRASAAVVQNEAGKTVGMVSVLTDVTKQKELARMEREFIAHVTHELRAPLSAIRAALEILQGQFVGKLGPDDERMLGTALRNSDRLADLIRDILDFGKIESGQMSAHPEPVDAEKIAREAVDSLQPWAQKKGIGLALEVPQRLPQVHADARRTVQVLVNLLSNALKFTPKEGRITVRLGLAQDGQGHFVRYAVTDTGPGIAKADQEKIFQKFVQIAAGEKHVGGTGLGLAIAKALIHLQKGQMGVDSEEGKGSTFHFTLPIYVPPADVAPIVAPAPPPPKPWWKRLLGLD